MVQSSPSLSRLLSELRKLPGVGEKTALRLALHLLRAPDQLTFLATSLLEVRERVTVCTTCFGITEENPCPLCAAPRDDSTLCVVEEAADMLAVERTHAFRGRYHVLQGALSPLQGVTPGDLRIDELLARLHQGGVREVVIATNFTVEGEATALYLARLIKPLGIRVTRLAHGIPTGSDLEYVDAATVQHALEGRSEL
jgi:recombination protein RecR